MLATAAGHTAGLHISTSYHQRSKSLLRCLGSKRCGSNTAEKAVYLPSRLLPTNSCDTFILPDDFHKHPPALQLGPHLLCQSRLEAIPDFSFRRRRTCIHQLLFIKVLGASSRLALQPQTSMVGPGTECKSDFPASVAFSQHLLALLTDFPQNYCTANGHRKLYPTRPALFQPRSSRNSTP